MQTAGSTPLNDALNRPKTRSGLDYRVAMGCLLAGVCAALFVNLFLGIALAFALPTIARFALRRDSQMYRLWSLSFHQRAHYDPGKAAR